MAGLGRGDPGIKVAKWSLLTHIGVVSPLFEYRSRSVKIFVEVRSKVRTGGRQALLYSTGRGR